MSDAQNVARLLNPCVFHLQKLGLELKCPLCLHLLNKPMLLPCNHIVCSSCVPKWSQISTQCPACLQPFSDQEVKPASYMENIVCIYKSLDATFNSTLLPFLSTDSGTPVSLSNSTHQLWKGSTERLAGGNNKRTYALAANHDGSGAESNKYFVPEELDVKLAPEISPRSSPSVDAKDMGHNNVPVSASRITENQGGLKSTGDDFVTTVQVDNNNTFHMRELKKQKKLSYGSSEAVLQSHGYKQQTAFQSDPATVSYSNEECKFKEKASVISTPAQCDAPYVDEGDCCAFCLSSKITEGTGPLLYYANGKPVTRNDGHSNAIPVHIKCVEWSPQVYFSGEMVMNLESELARASKLKCSKCGLKGAALGCFAKSCRRTYHMPCAMDITGCRWDCEEFLMLCPVHKSIKFPSERSNYRKPHNGEKSSLHTQSASTQLNFWATSPTGPHEWVLCASALSTEEKLLMMKFAKTCGATVAKSWNPKVTHVIAATDPKGAYSRTLKVLMAILNGRWILTMDWIRACMEANCPMDEEPYEVNLDNHGFCDGPKMGRLRFSNNASKLFKGLRFYLNGEFIPSFKFDLYNLIKAGEGTVIESMEQMVVQEHNPQVIPTAFIVYNNDFSQVCATTAGTSSPITTRLLEAESMARDANALVIPHTWILESIAACKLLPQP